MELFQRFLIALSVLGTDERQTSRKKRRFVRRNRTTYLPGRSLAIMAHLFPRRACASTMIRSSSAVHCSLRTAGLSWLCQRSRHCLPIRPVRWDEMKDQLCGPCLSGKTSGGRRAAETAKRRKRERSIY